MKLRLHLQKLLRVLALSLIFALPVSGRSAMALCSNPMVQQLLPITHLLIVPLLSFG